MFLNLEVYIYIGSYNNYPNNINNTWVDPAFTLIGSINPTAQIREYPISWTQITVKLHSTFFFNFSHKIF